MLLLGFIGITLLYGAGIVILLALDRKIGPVLLVLCYVLFIAMLILAHGFDTLGISHSSIALANTLFHGVLHLLHGSWYVFLISLVIGIISHL